MKKQVSRGDLFVAALRTPWVLSSAYLLATVVLVIWFLVVASTAYDPSNSAGAKIMSSDRQFYGDIFTRLPRNLSSLVTVGLLLFAAVGAGRLVLQCLRLHWRDGFERNFFALAVGLSLYTFVTLAIGPLGLLRREAILPLILVGACVTAAFLVRVAREITARQPTCQLKFGAQRPREIIAVVLLAVTIGFYLYIALLVYFCWARFGQLLMGMVAGLIFIATPVVSWTASTGGNDAAVTLYTLLLIHSLLRWMDEPQSCRWLLLAGALSGYAMGIKWTGAYMVVVTVAVMAAVLYDRARQAGAPAQTLLLALLKASALYGGAAVLFVLPSLAHGYFMTGNPVYPLLNDVFHSPYWNHLADASARRAYESFGQDHSFWGFLSLPWTSVAGSHHYRAVIGPAYLVLLPVATLVLFTRRDNVNHAPRILAAISALWIMVWFVSGALETRFLQVILPVLAMFVAFPLLAKYPRRWSATMFRVALWAVVLPIIVSGNSLFVPLLKNANVPSVAAREFIPWDYLYNGQREFDVQLTYVPMLAYINDHLSACRDKVYDATGLILYYLYSKIELFNGAQYDGPAGLGQWNLTQPGVLRHLAAARVTYLDVFRNSIPTLAPELGSHFVRIHTSVTGETLLQLKYPAYLSSQRPSLCSGE